MTSVVISGGGKERTVIFVGRFVDSQKNISGLLRIWSKTNKNGWVLKLVGEGKDRRKLEAYSKELGLSSSVEFLGWVDQPTKVMLQASVFCLTSYIEGFGLVLAEAMACGCPVISYDLPYGPSDIITDGVDGFLIQNGDENAFADRLSKLLSDEDEIQTMSAAAIDKAKQFEIGRISDIWIKNYSELLASENSKRTSRT